MITVYTKEGCPKCRVLKMKLEKKGIEYQECHDLDKVEQMGFMSLPVLVVDDEKYPFEKAVKYVNER